MQPLVPAFHVLAGPNGAGKSTLYELVLRTRLRAEFVNPDRLVFESLGRHAQTREEAQLGQRLAEARRDALMAARQSLVTESTFSHPSKLELVQRAKALGYRVVVYHVHLETVEQAIARVAHRETQGGHPVPEANLRGRYERNPAIIRGAVLMADQAIIFDNSALGRPPRRLIAFSGGHAIFVATDLPAWAAQLYGPDL
jgi:predicted ABC-type ATPase